MTFWPKKRSSNDPQTTPRLASVALPDTSPVKTPPRRHDHHHNHHPPTSSVSRPRPVDSSLRSKTPHPAPSSRYLPQNAIVVEKPRPRTTPAAIVTTADKPLKGEKSGSAQPSILKTSKPVDSSDIKKPLTPKNIDEKGRSSSLSNGNGSTGLKGILKQPKTLLDDDHVCKPNKSPQPNKGGGSPDSIQDPLAYQKPKSGVAVAVSSYHPSSKIKTKDIDKNSSSSSTSSSSSPSPPAAYYPEKYGQAQLSQYFPAPIAPRPTRPPVIATRMEQQGMPPTYYIHPPHTHSNHHHHHQEPYGGQGLGLQRGASTHGSGTHNHRQPPPTHPHRTQSHFWPQSAGPYTTHSGYPWQEYGQDQQQQQLYRTVSQGGAGDTPLYTTGSKYVKGTYRTYVRQKDEDISLSWPFIDPLNKPLTHQRWKMPQLFFDVGMDPTDDRIGVRAYIPGTGYTRPLTEEEKQLPASSHCKVTKMIIYCKDMERWPVIAEREEGLRCMDVFEAIFRTFAVPLTEEERGDYMPEYLAKCVPAFRQRCRDGPGITAVNEQRGMCRVDVLRTQKIFRGLSKKGREVAWTLTLDRPQGRGSTTAAAVGGC